MKSWNFHYKTLDHWRGLAALWVMMFHGFGTSYDKVLHPIVEPLKYIAKFGWLGVHIFFVISGYCITASAYKTILNNKTPYQFFTNRVFRLFPVYWIAFIITIAINLIAAPFNKTGFGHNLPATWQSWIGNIFLIQPYLKVPNYSVVYWSLVVEFAFYITVAMLLVFAGIFNKKYAFFVGLILAFASPFIYIKELQFINLWGEFFCGVLLFVALYSRQYRRQNTSLFLMILLCILSVALNLNNIDNQLYFSSLFGILLYYLYIFDVQIDNLIQLNWLKTCGAFSYSLYLLHVPFQGKIINFATRFISYDSWKFLLLQLMGWIVVIIISYSFYSLVENPLNEWRCKTRIHGSKMLLNKS